MSDGRIPACPVCARAGRMRERWVSDGGWPVKASHAVWGLVVGFSCKTMQQTA